MHNVSSTTWIDNDLSMVIKGRARDIGRKNSTGVFRLRAAFKYLRGKPKYDLLGDYPLIFYGVTTLRRYNLPVTRKNILSAMDASKELCGRFSGKLSLVDQLEKAGRG